MRKNYIIIMLVCLGISGLVIFQAKKIPNDDMAPSLLKGDWIWVTSTESKRGDVVLIRDPHDPNKSLLRRIVGLSPDEVQANTNGSLRRNGKTLRQREMGTVDDFKIIQESTWSDDQSPIQYLIQRNLSAPHTYERESQLLESNGVYLLADNRDVAIDSRWWGPIQKDEIQGVVWLRIGKGHSWRSWFEKL